jgi:hypothetical protein
VGKLTITQLARFFVVTLFLTLSVRVDAIAPRGETLPTTSGMGTAETVTPRRSGIEIIPQVSLLSPSKLELHGPLFTVPYNEGFEGLPSIQLGIALPLVTWGNLDIAAVARAGYASREGYVRLRNNDGFERRVPMRLRWLPISGALRFRYRIPGVDFFLPSISVGSGVNLLQQSGFSGADGDFTVPFLSVTPAVTFLDGRGIADWFGGFTFGTSFLVGIGSPQTMRSWSFDLSLNLLL